MIVNYLCRSNARCKWDDTRDTLHYCNICVRCYFYFCVKSYCYICFGSFYYTCVMYFFTFVSDLIVTTVSDLYISIRSPSTTPRKIPNFNFAQVKSFDFFHINIVNFPIGAEFSIQTFVNDFSLNVCKVTAICIHCSCLRSRVARCVL